MPPKLGFLLSISQVYDPWSPCWSIGERKIRIGSGSDGRVWVLVWPQGNAAGTRAVPESSESFRVEHGGLAREAVAGFLPPVAMEA